MIFPVNGVETDLLAFNGAPRIGVEFMRTKAGWETTEPAGIDFVIFEWSHRP